MLANQTNLNPFLGYSLVKYDSLGEKKWLQRYSPLFPHSYGGYAMDKEGDVYVSFAYGDGLPGIQTNAIVVKYDTYGTVLWERNFGDVNFSSNNTITHLAVDTLGHLYALGYTQDTDPDYNWLFVACLDADSGVKLWRTDMSGVHYSQAFRLLSDRVEAVSTEFRPDSKYFVIAQFDFAGDLIQSHAKPYSSIYLLDFNHISNDGAVVFGNRGFAHRAVKVDVQGDTLWDYNLPPVVSDQGLRVLSITEDDSNYTYITGCHNHPGTYIDAVTTKLDDSGEVVWQKIYTQPDSLVDAGIKIAQDNNYIYVVGSSENSITKKAEALVLLYGKTNGETLAELRLNHNISNNGSEIQILQDGFVVACISNGDYDLAIIDSVEIVTYRFRLSKPSSTTDVLQSQAYLEAYPNPALDFCFVTQGAERPFKQLSLFDFYGRMVKSQPFPHLIEQVDVSGLPPGEYILKATGDAASAVTKILVVR